MITIIMDRNNTSKKPVTEMVSMNGSLEDICHNLCIAMASIYQSMKLQDPSEAEAFRGIMSEMLAKDSPTWRVKVQGTTIMGGRTNGQA